MRCPTGDGGRNRFLDYCPWWRRRRKGVSGVGEDHHQLGGSPEAEGAETGARPSSPEDGNSNNGHQMSTLKGGETTIQPNSSVANDRRRKLFENRMVSIETAPPPVCIIVPEEENDDESAPANDEPSGDDMKNGDSKRRQFVPPEGRVGDFGKDPEATAKKKRRPPFRRDFHRESGADNNNNNDDDDEEEVLDED